MIELCYSAPNELDIAGTLAELADVRRAVLEAAKSGAYIELDANPSIDTTPYDEALSKLVVETAVGPARVSVSNGTLRIAGSSDCLEALASFLNFKPDAQKGDHTHYEYYKGNKWIAPDSLPLVVSVR